MNKFKAGDIVTIDMDAPVNTRSPGNRRLANRLIGERLVVRRVVGAYVYLEGHPASLLASRFKLVPKIKVEHAPVVEWVLMLHKNGKYLPSPEPRVMTSRAQALRVAAMMSEKHGGRFVVFESVADAVMPEFVKPTPAVREFRA